MKTILYRHGKSKGGRDLARELGIYCMGSKDLGTPPEKCRILNWGASVFHFNTSGYQFINTPNMVLKAADKAVFFKHLGHITGIPEWTFDSRTAQGWLNNGSNVFCRIELSANNGKGIHIAEPGSRLPDSPLYTKHFPTTREWRVHIIGKEVVQVDIKLRMNDAEPNIIQNFDNGYILSQKVGPKYNRPIPDVILKQTMAVHKSLGMDFAAYDVGYNTNSGEAKVFEANSAPALDGSTLETYTQVFEAVIQS